MKIGDKIFVRGTIDEIRKDVVIIKNKGGYFGTVQEEIQEGWIDTEKLWRTTRGRTVNQALEIIDYASEKMARDEFKTREELMESLQAIREQIKALSVGANVDIGDFSDKLWLNSRNRAFDEVLEIIDEDIGEHIYRDAFRSREDLKELYDRVRGHIVALKGGDQE